MASDRRHGGVIACRQTVVLIGIALAIACANCASADQQPQPIAADGPTMNSPKADCEALMNSVLPFARQTLDRYGEFYPFGGAMRVDGQLTSVGGYEGWERPPSSDVIKLLKVAFIAGAKESHFKATALVYDVRVTLPSTGEKSDAIAVSLNHRDGYSVIILFPYKIENSKAVLGAPFAQKGEADVFPAK